jgi:hypothetical protein
VAELSGRLARIGLFGRGPVALAASLLALVAIAALAGGLVRVERGGLPGVGRLNVLLVVIDTLGGRHVGHLSPGPSQTPDLSHTPEVSHTPEIDALARGGVAFARAYSPAPWTRPAVASLLTGQMPSRHGVAGPLDRLAQRRETLAEALAGQGFATGAVTSQPLLRRGASRARRGHLGAARRRRPACARPVARASTKAWFEIFERPTGSVGSPPKARRFTVRGSRARTGTRSGTMAEGCAGLAQPAAASPPPASKSAAKPARRPARRPAETLRGARHSRRPRVSRELPRSMRSSAGARPRPAEPAGQGSSARGDPRIEETGFLRAQGLRLAPPACSKPKP